MKSFLIAVFLLLLMIGGVLGNGFYIRGISDELSEKVEKLTPSGTFSEDYRELRDLWEKNQSLICLSVPHRDVEAVCEKIILLGSYEGTGDLSAFEAEKATLSDLLEEIRKSEQISADNIF